MRKFFLQIALLVMGYTAWFGLLMPWDRMPDPDAFYHAKISFLTWTNGPIQSFPWLDLTSLGKNFADQHFLFHVAQIPFVSSLGLIMGSHVSSVAFAVVCLFAISIVFYKLKLKTFWAWPVLLAVTHPFSTRMIQGKASPLAIAIFFAAIGLMLTPDDRMKKTWRWIGLSLCSFVFSLLHGGWIILIGAACAMILGKALYGLSLNEQKFKSAILNSGWMDLVFVVFGVVLGLLAHPGRREILNILYVQVIKIGVFTPNNLAMGMEWNAVDLGGGVGVFSIFGVLLLLCLVGILFSRRKMERRELLESMRPVVVLAPLFAGLFAMTIKSIRFAEYFQPVLALWTAYLAQFVDWETFFDKLRFEADVTKPEKKKNIFGRAREMASRKILVFTILLSSSAILFNHIWNAYTSFHSIYRFMDNQFATPMRAISQDAQPGDRVYHACWDEFPVLFAQNDQLRYISGLDPTFLYEASSTMALEYQDFAFKAASSTTDALWSFVAQKTGSKYLLIDETRWSDLARLIEKDPRYIKLAQGDGGTAYRVSSDH